MSKIDKLKLRKIEEVSDNELKMAPMSYWNGSSGSSGSWLSGGGTSEEDCMSQDMYWELTEQGTSVSNVYVCGIGYVSGTSEVWGSSGSGSNDGSYGSDGSWSGGSNSGSDDTDGYKGGNQDSKARGYIPSGYTVQDAIDRCKGEYYDSYCYFGNRGGQCKVNSDKVLQCESPTSSQACIGAEVAGTKCWAINSKGRPANGNCQYLTTGSQGSNGLDCFMK